MVSDSSQNIFVFGYWPGILILHLSLPLWPQTSCSTIPRYLPYSHHLLLNLFLFVHLYFLLGFFLLPSTPFFSLQFTLFSVPGILEPVNAHTYYISISRNQLSIISVQNQNDDSPQIVNSYSWPSFSCSFQDQDCFYKQLFILQTLLFMSIYL